MVGNLGGFPFAQTCHAPYFSLRYGGEMEDEPPFKKLIRLPVPAPVFPDPIEYTVSQKELRNVLERVSHLVKYALENQLHEL